MKYTKQTEKNIKKKSSTWHVDVARRFKAKKSLGQNFLKSQKALNQIIEAGNVSSEDIVLEIGPGKGALTKYLLEAGAKVVAVEMDKRSVEFLNEEFKNEIESKQLILIEGDILKVNVEEILNNKPYKLIANIPYYITGEIMRKFLSADYQPQTIVFLVQKEVAERIVSRDNKESVLSISVKAYGEPKYISTVKKEYFSPKPKVDSAIIAINNISKDNFTDVSEERFFEIVKKGFAHKRKKVSSNLKKVANETVLKNCEIRENSRPEELGVEKWLCLSKD